MHMRTYSSRYHDNAATNRKADDQPTASTAASTACCGSLVREETRIVGVEWVVPNGGHLLLEALISAA